MRLYPELAYKLKLGGLEYSYASEFDPYVTRFSFSSEARFALITNSNAHLFMLDINKPKFVTSKNCQ